MSQSSQLYMMSAIVTPHIASYQRLDSFSHSQFELNPTWSREEGGGKSTLCAFSTEAPRNTVKSGSHGVFISKLSHLVVTENVFGPKMILGASEFRFFILS